MAITQTIQEFALQSSQGSIVNLIVGLILTLIFTFITSRLYVKYGSALSNRERFARNFVILGMVTTLVISVVKSSLALSLGLVGALSILRFRAAIKDPEEIVYLFLVIGIGLGLGANQWIITTTAFVIIVAAITGRSYLKRNPDMRGLSLLITIPAPRENSFSKIRQVLARNCKSVNLKRYDENQIGLEALFIIDFNNIRSLENIKDELKSSFSQVQISFLDNII